MMYLGHMFSVYGGGSEWGYCPPPWAILLPHTNHKCERYKLTSFCCIIWSLQKRYRTGLYLISWFCWEKLYFSPILSESQYFVHSGTAHLRTCALRTCVSRITNAPIGLTSNAPIGMTSNASIGMTSNVHIWMTSENGSLRKRSYPDFWPFYIKAP